MKTKTVIVMLLLGGISNADHGGMKGMHVNGSAEAGFTYSSTTALKQTQFGLDHLNLKMMFDVSDTTRVVLDNSMAIGTTATTAGTLASNNNSSTYFSTAAIAPADGRFIWANNDAFIEHDCTKNIKAVAGHFRVPFGMESMGSRYDMASYFYSRGFAVANSYRWFHDVGFRVNMMEVLPGNLEVAIVDGRNNGIVAALPTGTREVSSTPGTAVRWSYPFTSGEMTLTPVLSTYLARWRGGPKDLGISAGLMWKMGTLWANMEWVSTSFTALPAAAPDTKIKDWSLYVEPGVDLGMANLSLKADFNSNTVDPAAATSDINLGAALSHVYQGGYRVRLAYQFSNLSEKRAVKGHDIRLFFGTKW